MNNYAIRCILMFIVCVLIQVLICNHIIIFHVAVPIIFIYFIIRLRLSISTNALMTYAFILGLIVDIFSDTLGVNALSCIILAVLKRPVLMAYCQHDDTINDIIPSIKRLGGWTYAKYLSSMIVIYCLIYFILDFFSFANLGEILIMTFASALLSFILLFATDSLLIRSSEKRL